MHTTPGAYRYATLTSVLYVILPFRSVFAEVPPRLERLLTKSNMIVTGLPRMEPRKHDISLGDSSHDETSRVGSSHSHRGATRARLRDWPSVNRPPQFSHRDSSAETTIPPFISSTTSASTDYEPNFGRVFGGTPMSTYSSGTVRLSRCHCDASGSDNNELYY